MKKIIYLLITLIILYLASGNLFADKKNITDKLIESKVQIGNTQHDDKDTVVFLVLRISKDSIQGNNIITLIKEIKSPGELKNISSALHDTENFLTIEVFEGENLINTIIIDHPLYKKVESVDENYSLFTKAIENNTKDFIIKFLLIDNTSIKISETVKKTNKFKSILKTIKL